MEMQRALALLGVLWLAGCHQYLDPRLYRQLRRDLPDRPAGEVLQVRSLGVQGFVVRRGADAVLFPPLYSNPGLDLVVAGNRVLPHVPAAIEENLAPGWVADVSAILVGHSHYDHLMDVPWIAEHRATRATLYGSRTAAHILDSFGLGSRVVALNGWKAGDADRVDYRACPRRPKNACLFAAAGAGEWVSPAGYETRLRLRALGSQHSPQFARLPVTSTGCYDGPLARPPRTADEWRLGDTFAYLVDFLDAGGGVAFRVYYQDSPTEPGFGYVPEALDTPPRRVDLALLCGGAFDQVRENPSGIVSNTDPRFVLFGHWDNFFRAPSKPLETLFSTPLGSLRDRMNALRSGSPGWKGEYWFATAGTLFVFEPAATTETHPGAAGPGRGARAF